MITIVSARPRHNEFGTCFGSFKLSIKHFILAFSLRYLWGCLTFFFIGCSSAFLFKIQKRMLCTSSQVQCEIVSNKNKTCCQCVLHCSRLLRRSCEATMVSGLSVTVEAGVSDSPQYVCLKSDINKITNGLTRYCTENGRRVDKFTENMK